MFQRRSARLAALLALALAGAGCTYSYLYYFAEYRFWFPPPAGSGPAGPPVPGGPFKKVWTEQPVLLLGLGDSITAGFGARPNWSMFDRLVRTPPGEWEDIAGICLERVLPGLKMRNLAVSGSNSIQHIEDQVARLETAAPDVLGLVVLTTGGNDLIHWYGQRPPAEGAMYGAVWDEGQPWIQNFATRLERMIEGISDAFPGGAQIFLANIYDPSDGVGNPKAAGLPPWPDLLRFHEAYNVVIEQAAARHEHVHLVDIHSEFLGHGVHCVQFWRPHYRRSDPHYWYYDNLEDPNERGYDALRRLFLLAMAEVLAPNDRIARNHSSPVRP